MILKILILPNKREIKKKIVRNHLVIDEKIDFFTKISVKFQFFLVTDIIFPQKLG